MLLRYTYIFALLYLAACTKPEGPITGKYPGGDDERIELFDDSYDDYPTVRYLFGEVSSDTYEPMVLRFDRTAGQLHNGYRYDYTTHQWDTLNIAMVEQEIQIVTRDSMLLNLTADADGRLVGSYYGPDETQMEGMAVVLTPPTGNLRLYVVERTDSLSYFGDGNNPFAESTDTYLHPVVADDELARLLQLSYFDTLLAPDAIAALAMQGKQYIDDFKKEIEEARNDEYTDDDLLRSFAYARTSTQVRSVAFYQNDVLVLADDLYTYMGGAHGMYYTDYTTIDLRRPAIVTLDDLMRPGYEPTLLAAIKMEAAKREQVEYPDDLKDISDNFYVLPDTLVFYYGVYEIAPYAAGAFEFKVPTSAVSAYLKEDTLLDRLVGVEPQ